MYLDTSYIKIIQRRVLQKRMIICLQKKELDLSQQKQGVYIQKYYSFQRPSPFDIKKAQ